MTRQLFMAIRRPARWLTPLLLLLHSDWILAHGQSQQFQDRWHKLEFWNGEFHLFAMIFWLALLALVVAVLVKLIKRLQHRGE